MILLYLAVIILVPLFFQYKVMSTYKRYSKVRSTSGMTGKEVAEKLLVNNGINDVQVLRGEGELTDYYDSRNKVIMLSPDNYDNASVAGSAVAAHETGHAIQHATSYGFLTFRNALFPISNIGSKLSFWLILVGIVLTVFASSSIGQLVLMVGIGFFALAVLFQVVTLPVEFDASKRAMAELTTEGIIEDKEIRHAKKVLNAAAMTYVASTAVALAELLRLILMAQNN